jgi:hypothetical protein
MKATKKKAKTKVSVKLKDLDSKKTPKGGFRIGWGG